MLNSLENSQYHSITEQEDKVPPPGSEFWPGFKWKEWQRLAELRAKKSSGGRLPARVSEVNSDGTSRAGSSTFHRTRKAR